jgi:1,4-dihydroxy-2-naphthoate octaprenyltransferase
MAIENAPGPGLSSGSVFLCMGIATLFIGSIYPLTQIYQHQADKNDGVISLSFKLGYPGTFVFSALLFSAATLLMFLYFRRMDQMKYFPLFLGTMLPVVAWFLYWFVRVIRNVAQANYRNTMWMNLVTATCMNLFFLFLTLNRYERWY